MNNNILLLAPAIALLLGGCAGNNGDKQKDQAVEATPVVSVSSASKQYVSESQIFASTVQAYTVNNIAPQSAGRIRKLNVDVGSFVSAGQILAEMDRVQLDQAALKLKNDETELNRVKGLLAEGGISQSDYESLELAFKVSKSTYDNLEDNTILRSPISGVVTARNYDKGDMFAMSAPIFTVQQITPVKLLVAVSETDYTKVKKGDTVTLTADALPGKSFSGSVVRLYPVMDPSSHTFNVEVNVRNADRLLRPGMYARVTVNFGGKDSVVIPDTAVLKQQGSGQRTVYVLNEDNTVTLKVVEVGRHFDLQYQILDGIEEGEKVVYNGQTVLKSGDKVEVQQ